MQMRIKPFLLLPILLISITACSVDNKLDISKGWSVTTEDKPEYKNINIDDSRWRKVDLPGWVVEKKGRNTFWLRKTFVIPEGYKNQTLAVSIGKVWDVEKTYFNGVNIGSTGSEYPDFNSAWNQDRFYYIPSELIKYGEPNDYTI